VVLTICPTLVGYSSDLSFDLNVHIVPAILVVCLSYKPTLCIVFVAYMIIICHNV